MKDRWHKTALTLTGIAGVSLLATVILFVTGNRLYRLSTIMTAITFGTAVIARIIDDAQDEAVVLELMAASISKRTIAPGTRDKMGAQRDHRIWIETHTRSTAFPDGTQTDRAMNIKHC
ncbi:hypothetical protein ACQ4M3_01070 [Leptolyngbya sp. AN03gr2]|uniref:hypothetical protein n=1 Tax=unclassified Leptolyngbya TaxID=2650499 RepID=UPI003D31D1F9